MSEAFRPHCVILCAITVPQPIFVAATKTYSARELEAQNYLKGSKLMSQSPIVLEKRQERTHVSQGRC